jgi:hypothetical protein
VRPAVQGDEPVAAEREFDGHDAAVRPPVSLEALLAEAADATDLGVGEERRA